MMTTVTSEKKLQRACAFVYYYRDGTEAYIKDAKFEDLCHFKMYNLVPWQVTHRLVQVVKPVKAYVLGGKPWHEIANESHCKMTYEQLFENNKSKLDGFLPYMELDFCNQVILLAQLDEGQGWVYLKFNNYTSSILKFSTNDEPIQVINNFVDFVQNDRDNTFGERELPISYFEPLLQTAEEKTEIKWC